jgi:uncharacterized protein (TIGR01370 family)
MRRRVYRSTIFVLSSILLIFLVLRPSTSRDKESVRWAAYYSGVLPSNGFSGFQLLVLDSDSHPLLSPLLPGRKVLGYVSVGEAEQTRNYFDRVKTQGLFAGENENWPGSFFVDVRDRRWTEQVLTLVRATIQQGFLGVFLDTVDDAEYLEDKDPRSYAGMKDAMARLILEVRRAFPDIPIAVNRGYAILPQIDGSIDYVLGESVRTDYDFTTKAYRRVPEDLYREQVATLKAAKVRNPKLTILMLDYWEPGDAAGIKRVYQEQRANGFIPYVATLKLDQLVEEPR